MRAQEEVLDPSYAAEHSCEPNNDGWCYTDLVTGAPDGDAFTVFDYPAASVRVVFD